MSHSEQTLHFGLPKYVGTDIINPLTDFNDANDAIDEALYNANSTAAVAEAAAQGAIEQVGTYDARIAQAEGYAQEAITKADNTMDMIAEEFDPLKQGGYAVGDTCIYNGVLYEFINVHTGAWDASDVKVSVITEAVKSTIAQGKAEIEEETQEALEEIAGQTQKVTATQEMISHLFDPTRQYRKSDMCYYADKLYQFNEDHLGVWTGTDVRETDITQRIRKENIGVRTTDSASVATTWGQVLNELRQKIDFSRITSKSKFMLYGLDANNNARCLHVSNVHAYVYNPNDTSNNYVVFTMVASITGSGSYITRSFMIKRDEVIATQCVLTVPTENVGAVTGEITNILNEAIGTSTYGTPAVLGAISYY